MVSRNRRMLRGVRHGMRHGMRHGVLTPDAAGYRCDPLRYGRAGTSAPVPATAAGRCLNLQAGRSHDANTRRAHTDDLDIVLYLGEPVCCRDFVRPTLHLRVVHLDRGTAAPAYEVVVMTG